MTHSHFWVSNPTLQAVPVTIAPASAVPGNNGALHVARGGNVEFPEVSYSPNHFISRPGQTTEISVTTSLRTGLGPGVYLLPAEVVPTPPAGAGNIKIVQSVVALLTFQVPGATNARMSASFITPPARARVAPAHRFGFVTVELANSGLATLQVLDDSGTSVFAYTETTASQSPLGSAAFSPHTAGEPNDLRTPSALYFGGHYRDFPLAWHATPVGFGLDDLHGFVTYQPGPGRLVSTAASTSILVISPWWEYLPWVAIGILALVLRRRIRRRQDAALSEGRRARGLARLVGRVLTSVVIAGLLAAPAVASRPLVLTCSCAPAALLALTAVATRGRHAVRIAVIAQIVTAVALVVGAAGIVLSALTLLPADMPLAVVVGAGTTVLVTWWSSWSIRPRKSPRHLRGASQAPEPAGVGA